MTVRYSDADIQGFIEEPKELPGDYLSLIRLRPKRGHREASLKVAGDRGSDFRLILRQSALNVLDLSVILAVLPPDTNQPFRLRRYNGKSHRHTNKIERATFYGFHIHYATERYQEFSGVEDQYAEPADSFSDLYSALTRLIDECGFVPPPGSQRNLF
jgi:hypothetical protein